MMIFGTTYGLCCLGRGFHLISIVAVLGGELRTLDWLPSCACLHQVLPGRAGEAEDGLRPSPDKQASVGMFIRAD